MRKYQITTNSPDETMKLGEKLANFLKPGDVITLEGDLGAGKTTFTKGLAKGLNIARTVNSPTFTIVKEYEGKYPLYHIDAYRLAEGEEDLGFEEYFNSDGITVVEWSQYISSFIPQDRLEISILNGNDMTRNFVFTPIGSHFEKICEELNL